MDYIHFDIQERKAIEILSAPESYGGLPNRKQSDRLVYLWEYPSFAPYVSWTIYRGDKDARFVRRLVWDRLGDAGKALASPSIFGYESAVPLADIDHLLNDLNEIVMPPFARDMTFGLDGVIRGVEFGSSLSTCRLQWWCDYPEAWKPLHQWYENCTEFFESSLPESTADIRNKS
jgi:hypothetical protein